MKNQNLNKQQAWEHYLNIGKPQNYIYFDINMV